jgi:hypothetical protein
MIKTSIEPISLVCEKYKIVIFTNAKVGFRTCWEIIKTLNQKLTFIPVIDSNWLYQYDPIKNFIKYM